MSTLDKKIQEWLDWDSNVSTKTEIEHLVKINDYKTLEKLLLNRIQFGTAGFRGRRGAGYTCINDLRDANIIKIKQPKKRPCEEMIDPENKAVNPKKSKICDSSVQNLSTSAPVKAKCVSARLVDEPDKNLSKE